MVRLSDFLHGIRVVPAVIIEEAEHAPHVAAALVDGGLPCVEVTFRTPAAEESIRRIAKLFPQVMLGAGTVLTVEQAERAVGAGAMFVVSPGFDARVVAWCQTHAVPVMPGVATATEIIMALAMGIDVLKFFPAEALGGVRTLQATSAAFGDVKFVPTGGINARNLLSYLQLKMVLAVGGTWLATGKLINSGAFDEITRLTREAVEIAAHAREGGTS